METLHQIWDKDGRLVQEETVIEPDSLPDEVQRLDTLIKDFTQLCVYVNALELRIIALEKA